jgi:hypothetical protein
METVSQVAEKALRGAGAFIRAFTGMQLSFAGACPAFGNTSVIFGDLHIGTRNHSGTHLTSSNTITTPGIHDADQSVSSTDRI